MLLALRSINLDAPLQLSGQSLILTELILPRNAIARKAVLKDVRLTRGRRSLARQPFYEKALLKEKVDGLFGLRVSVTRPLKNPELNQFLRRLLATGLESSVDLLSSLLIRYSPLGDVLEEAGEWGADRLLESSSNFIATGGLDLESESLTPGTLMIDLKLTETIRKSDLPPGPKSREKRKTAAVSYKKGTAVGQISFDLTV
jgi:hypothetical protein